MFSAIVSFSTADLVDPVHVPGLAVDDIRTVGKE